MSYEYVSCDRAKELERDYVKQDPQDAHYWEKATTYACKQNKRALQDFDKEFAKFEKDYFDILPESVKVVMNFPGMAEVRMIKWMWYIEK